MLVTTMGLICGQRSTLPAVGHRFHSAGPWNFHLSEAELHVLTHTAPLQKRKNRTAGGLPSKARPPHYDSSGHASELPPERRLEGHQWGGPTHRSSNACYPLISISSNKKACLGCSCHWAWKGSSPYTGAGMLVVVAPDVSLQGQRQDVWFSRIY